MFIEHPVRRCVELRKTGMPAGMISFCSANDLVIEAAMDRLKDNHDNILIEATANQVNQYGGYTGMKPADFRNFVFSIAEKTGFPKNRIILAGDHLGPLTWSGLHSDQAMQEAKELVRQYILAGFSKIHIDTSMRLGNDDMDAKLDTRVIAKRGAILLKTAEDAFEALHRTDPQSIRPVYVIGSEVPIPGGSRKAGAGSDETLQITKARDFKATVSVYRETLASNNIENIWERVVAVVVQPGIEFGDAGIHEYSREAASGLCDALKEYRDLVFEGHSTDYQTAHHLRQMVEDGIAILKVGPALTFALREALFALSNIEDEIFKYNRKIRRSDFIRILDRAMVENPGNWKNYYQGSTSKIRLKRKFSYSDRCRYYLPAKEVREAIHRLLDNLKATDIPLTLISQHMPVQYGKIRSGTLENEPEKLLKDRVINSIDDYIFATASR